MKRSTAGNEQFGKMAGSVLKSAVVLRLSNRTKLNICAPISATSPSRKPLAVMLQKLSYVYKLDYFMLAGRFTHFCSS